MNYHFYTISAYIDMLEMWCKIIVLKTRKYDNTPVLQTLNRTASILTLARVVVDEKYLIFFRKNIFVLRTVISRRKDTYFILSHQRFGADFFFLHSLFSKCHSSIPRLLFRVSNLVCSCLLIGVLCIHQWRSQPRTPLTNTTSDSMSALPPGDMLR